MDFLTLRRAVSVLIIINSFTTRVVGAPQMILQPVFSIFPSSPIPSGTCRTPGLSIPWCCLPTSSFVRLVFFPHSLCLARWFWPDLMNGKHDHTTAVCVFLRSSGDLHVVLLPAGSWHGLPRWWSCSLAQKWSCSLAQKPAQCELTMPSFWPWKTSINLTKTKNSRGSNYVVTFQLQQSSKTVIPPQTAPPPTKKRRKKEQPLFQCLDSYGQDTYYRAIHSWIGGVVQLAVSGSRSACLRDFLTWYLLSPSNHTGDDKSVRCCQAVGAQRFCPETVCWVGVALKVLQVVQTLYLSVFGSCTFTGAVCMFTCVADLVHV